MSVIVLLPPILTCLCSGVPDLEELLVVAGHPLRPAVQRRPPSEEDLGGGVPVGFQTLWSTLNIQLSVLSEH